MCVCVIRRRFLTKKTLIFRYNHMTQNEFSLMTDVAKTFLHCLNHWTFEPPSARSAALSQEDASTYKINYTRWLVFCHVPAYCNTLRHFETTAVFGRTLLKAVYQYICQQLMSKFKNERDRMPVEKRAMFSQLPKFLDTLKHEVVNDESPIWNPAFKPMTGMLLQRKREKEAQVATGGASSAVAGTSSACGKKYNEPTNKKYKRDTTAMQTTTPSVMAAAAASTTTDGDDFTDDVVLKAIKRINESNYGNKIEVC